MREEFLSGYLAVRGAQFMTPCRTAGGRQILFRDIMPDNIILTSGREVRYEHDAASYMKQQERGDRVSLCMGALFFFRSPATL